MKTIFASALLVFSLGALAHPAGKYIINGDSSVTLTIKRVGRCPVGAGALTGTLRHFAFSPRAKAHPYAFKTGNYVEIHEGSKEIYVQVDTACVPKANGGRYAASHETFDVYSIQKI